MKFSGLALLLLSFSAQAQTPRMLILDQRGIVKGRIVPEPKYVAWNDDSPKTPAPSPWVVFPTQPTNEPPHVQPSPQPSPTEPAKLSADEIYVIESRDPAFLVVSPIGIVSVVQDVGPIRIRGRFVGGSGKAETRTFAGPTVFTIEAAASGRVELIVVKAGAKTEADVARRIIDVLVGPRPPPEPPTPPPDPTDPFVVALTTAWKTDLAPDKSNYRAMLKEIYTGMGNRVTRDPTLATSEQVWAALLAERKKFMPDDKLISVRRVIGDAMNQWMPVDKPLDRQVVEAAFYKVADALGGLR